jgi:hypothetical protein
MSLLRLQGRGGLGATDGFVGADCGNICIEEVEGKIEQEPDGEEIECAESKETDNISDNADHKSSNNWQTFLWRGRRRLVRRE